MEQEEEQLQQNKNGVCLHNYLGLTSHLVKHDVVENLFI